MSDTVLIVDDDETLAENVRQYLERQGWDVHVCDCAEKALERFGSLHPDVVLTDQQFPGIDGIELTRRITAHGAGCKVVVMTGYGDVRRAVDAMKAGAFDYLTKPLVLAELKLILGKAVAALKTERKLSFYETRDARDSGLSALLGESAQLQQLKGTIRQVLAAEARITDGNLPVVLIHGETGTGKELVARAMHYDGSRRNGPFIEINCANLPPHLLEAELFGHEKGAFTDARERRIGLVEAADGGTLFLDEIGEIELGLQAKLLKLLEDRTIRRLGSTKEIKVDLRIISATNRNLEQLVREGKFRSDLFFRLRTIYLAVPPLRARGNDILLLARNFLAQYAQRYGKPGLTFSTEAEGVLLRYSWPGNIREMRNLLDQAALLAQESQIQPGQLAICPDLASDLEPAPRRAVEIPAATEGFNLPEVERELMIKVLDKTDWNVTKSARMLGLTRDMLRYRIEKLGLARLKPNN